LVATYLPDVVGGQTPPRVAAPVASSDVSRTRAHSRGIKRILIYGVMTLGGSLAASTVTSGEVSAHATLVSADPASGSMLTAPPDHVALVFSETVGEPAALVVLDSSGNEIEGGALQVVDDTMSRTYDPSTFAPDVYTVSYQVTSADGHPISGTLTFMVHAEGDAAMPEAPASSSSTTDATPAVVIALAALLALGLGAALLFAKRVVALPDGNPPG
jgi:methionine-rich copper-binding protein CopC